MKSWKIGIIALAMLIVLGFLVSEPVGASVQKSNVNIAVQIARKYHKPIKMFDGNSTSVKKARKLLKDRKDKYVLVERVISYGNGGRYGTIDGKYIIAYNKLTEIGERVVSYLIYNPETSFEDDVMYVVDHGKVRGHSGKESIDKFVDKFAVDTANY